MDRQQIGRAAEDAAVAFLISQRRRDHRPKLPASARRAGHRRARAATRSSSWRCARGPATGSAARPPAWTSASRPKFGAQRRCCCSSDSDLAGLRVRFDVVAVIADGHRMDQTRLYLTTFNCGRGLLLPVPYCCPRLPHWKRRPLRRLRPEVRLREHHALARLPRINPHHRGNRETARGARHRRSAHQTQSRHSPTSTAASRSG